MITSKTYNHTTTFSYGPSQERVKTVYSFLGVAQKEKLFLPNYEVVKDLTQTGATKELHYILGADGLAAIYITENEANGQMYYVLKDHMGSITGLVDATGNLVNEMSYDAWGRRRNPADWTYYAEGSEPEYLTDRGYTLHEHLDKHALINMNGRVYDPLVGRFLSPDNYVQTPTSTQSLNRFTYCLNNPLKYTDPTGDFIGTASTFLWDLGTTLFTKRGIDPWNTPENRREAWRDFDPTGSWSKTNKAWKIDVGLLKTDPNKTIGGRTWELVSRFTWQLPQTVIVNAYNNITNVFYNRVNSVNYYGGTTVVDVDNLIWDFDKASGVTFGNYISGEGISADPFESGPYYGLSWGSYLLRHEYGHYIQSQRNGLAFLLKYGIPSAAGASWTESDAEYRSDKYFMKHYDESPYFFTNWNSYSSGYKPINAKWWEYAIIFGGGYVLGGGIDAAFNINKGR